jgi:hypothetical protein
MADRTGGKVNGLSDLKLVFFQRGSPELQLHDLLLLTVLPLDRGEYSSEICDCLKNSSFGAIAICRITAAQIPLFISTLSVNAGPDY